ncbi:hypothetical protein RFI_00574 [Reticulomyxa filosa]|uniref:Uncharacterized protein n=1 Tax=Reticulomyxa filosa TaxID=46433 RepID=X6PEF7_RETFI|nr:hypothetical protein RFI_00574 [Reticulomyxa filosa]|eukprot:ETO36488.1 hypothetical protein RFI_00574 [Reticulomyxa filosa]
MTRQFHRCTLCKGNHRSDFLLCPKIQDTREKSGIKYTKLEQIIIEKIKNKNVNAEQEVQKKITLQRTTYNVHQKEKSNNWEMYTKQLEKNLQIWKTTICTIDQNENALDHAVNNWTNWIVQTGKDTIGMKMIWKYKEEAKALKRNLRRKKQEFLIKNIGLLNEGNMKQLFAKFRYMNYNKISIIQTLVKSATTKEPEKISETDTEKVNLLAKWFSEHHQQTSSINENHCQQIEYEIGYIVAMSRNAKINSEINNNEYHQVNITEEVIDAIKHNIKYNDNIILYHYYLEYDNNETNLVNKGNNLLHYSQTGFRSWHNKSEHLLLVLETIQVSLDNNAVTSILYKEIQTRIQLLELRRNQIIHKYISLSKKLTTDNLSIDYKLWEGNHRVHNGEFFCWKGKLSKLSIVCIDADEAKVPHIMTDEHQFINRSQKIPNSIKISFTQYTEQSSEEILSSLQRDTVVIWTYENQIKVLCNLGASSSPEIYWIKGQYKNQEMKKQIKIKGLIKLCYFMDSIWINEYLPLSSLILTFLKKLYFERDCA